MDTNAVFAILLLVIGVAILFAEIFIPSGGLLGVTTFFMLVVSLIFAYRAWGVSHPNIFGAFCVMLLLLVPTAVAYGFYLLPRTAFGKRVLLEAPEAQDVTPFSQESERLQKLRGQYGVALTPLNPGGLVNVSGERLHAQTEGLTVDAGMSIRVVDVRGIRVLVRPETPPEKEPDEIDHPPAEKSFSLDFEFPTNS